MAVRNYSITSYEKWLNGLAEATIYSIMRLAREILDQGNLSREATSQKRSAWVQRPIPACTATSRMLQDSMFVEPCLVSRQQYLPRRDETGPYSGVGRGQIPERYNMIASSTLGVCLLVPFPLLSWSRDSTCT